jgi:hypothetical protein
MTIVGVPADDDDDDDDDDGAVGVELPLPPQATTTSALATRAETEIVRMNTPSAPPARASSKIGSLQDGPPVSDLRRPFVTNAVKRFGTRVSFGYHRDL